MQNNLNPLKPRWYVLGCSKTDHKTSNQNYLSIMNLVDSIYNVYVPVISKTLEHIKTFNTNYNDFS